jgi:hypothetical protein
MGITEDFNGDTWIVTIEHTVSDGDVTLADRIEWASRLFAVPPYADAGSGEDSLTDILTDLMHYCRVNDLDFTKALNRASEHFGHELEVEQVIQAGGGR